MIIDKYLMAWDYAKKNKASVMLKAPAEFEASALYEVDFGKSGIIRLLFALRGLPTGFLTLTGITRSGFIVLEQNRTEIVIGLIAQPWRPSGNIITLAPELFTNFAEPDFVKVVWNFCIEQDRDNQLTISTETRIQCTSSKAKTLFSMYWFLIGFFSGAIRKEMLRIIKESMSAS